MRLRRQREPPPGRRNERPESARGSRGGAGSRPTPDNGPGETIRVLFHCDGHEIGGAEVSLGALLGLLSPRIEAIVMGDHPEIVNWLAAQRPGTRAWLVPQIRSRYDVRAIGAHYRALRKCRPDIMHISLNRPWGSPFDVLFGLMIPGIEVIAVEKLPRPHEHRRHAIYKRLTSRALAAHVTVGPTSAAQVAKLAGVPVHTIRVIPSGTADEPLTPLAREITGPVVGCLARLDRLKGIDVLIEAMPELPEVTVIVVGEGEERDALERQAAGLGVGSRVIFKGFSPRARDYLTTFDIYALPSRFEALGVSIIEAMLAGLPVVATTAGGIKDAVIHGETGLLVAPGDPVALARAIRTLLDAPQQAEAMGKAGRDRALREFTATRMAQDFESLYVELTGAGQSARGQSSPAD